MADPTLYVHDEVEGPVRAALQAVSFGARVVQTLFGVGGVEADVAVTTNVVAALRMMNETEQTRVFIVFTGAHERAAAEALASRSNGRVSAVDVLACVVPILRAIGEIRGKGE